MNFARRTGDGRGVYELPGKTAEGISAKAINGDEIVLRLPNGALLRSGIRINFNETGAAKPRTSIILLNVTVDINRQVAAILLLPKPIRANTAMGSGLPVLLTDNYVIEKIGVGYVEPQGNGTCIFTLTDVVVKNAVREETINFARRFSQVSELWRRQRDFPAPVQALLARHESIIQAGNALTEEPERIVSDLQSAISTQAANLGLNLDDAVDPLPHLGLVPRFLATALCTKPFGILTGPSGTGKSRNAIALALAFDYSNDLSTSHQASKQEPATCAAFVPVGADWTDQRNLLGYANPFGPKRTAQNGSETYLTYETTATLKLLLRASHPNYCHRPHFLLLDEMNLSHVERYFSSFLALMEADRSSAGSGRFELIDRDTLRLIADVLTERSDSPLELEGAQHLINVGRGLNLPVNVFIVGTVNVDETTYMFSPKVLDRAFVFELGSIQPDDYLDGTAEGVSQISEMAATRLFAAAIERADNRAWDDVPPLDVLRTSLTRGGMSPNDLETSISLARRALSGCYRLLKPVGFDFGYRVVNEFLHYLTVAFDAHKMDAMHRDGAVLADAVVWGEIVDDAVLSKLLPKIHGNRRELGGSLAALSAFLSGQITPEARYQLGSAPPVEIEAAMQLPISLSRSGEKAASMNAKLNASGYVTFIS